jgi:hypothetical protein
LRRHARPAGNPLALPLVALRFVVFVFKLHLLIAVVAQTPIRLAFFFVWQLLVARFAGEHNQNSIAFCEVSASKRFTAAL